MGLVPALPFAVGLYAFLLVRWARQFTVRERDVLQAPFLSVVELAFLCGGERRARSTIADEFQLRGESPEVLPCESMARLEQALSSAALLQKALAWRMVHLALALLPLAGLVAFSFEAGSFACERLLSASFLIGVVSFLYQLRHTRGAWWELSPLGQEVSFRFRARHRALGFVESWFPMLPSGPTMPVVGLVCGLFLVWEPSLSADAPRHRPSGPTGARTPPPHARGRSARLLSLDERIAIDSEFARDLN